LQLHVENVLNVRLTQWEYWMQYLLNKWLFVD